MITSPPRPLRAGDVGGDFDCGVPTLNDWLRTRAVANQASGGSRTFVVVEADKLIGYYALAAGSISGADTTGRFRRNMPDPVPVIILGRLAVDRSWAGRGIGGALVRDAARRTLAASVGVGVRGILVHEIDEGAAGFYRSQGFTPSPAKSLTLMATLDDLRATL